MKITGTVALLVVALMTSAVVEGAPTYTMSALTEPTPGASHYFGGHSGCCTGNGGMSSDQGISLSGDGKTLVVSSQGSGAVGKVYIFNRMSGNWKETQELDGVEGRDFTFGAQVLISKDGNALLVVSVIANYASPGVVDFYYADIYHYTKMNGMWKMDHIFVDPDIKYPGDGFGDAVSMSSDGRVVLASAPDENKAYIYTQAHGTWTQTLIEDPHGSSPYYQYFGTAVALNPGGTEALISNDVDASVTDIEIGSVYLYSFEGGQWKQQHLFQDPSPQSEFDQFGQSGVGFISDGTVYISDAGRNDGSRGTIYIYGKQWSSSWAVINSFTSLASVPFPGGFGAPFAASNGTFLIGVVVQCIHAHNPMQAYLYEGNSWLGRWSGPQIFSDPVGCSSAADFDGFVSAGMDMDSNHSTIVISAGGAQVGALQHAGAIYIYERQHPGF